MAPALLPPAKPTACDRHCEEARLTRQSPASDLPVPLDQVVRQLDLLGLFAGQGDHVFRQSLSDQLVRMVLADQLAIGALDFLIRMLFCLPQRSVGIAAGLENAG